MPYELTASTLNYVRQHANEDVRMLALRGCKDSAVDLPLALQQIQGRQTARKKLPSWAANDAIIYPPHLNLEQCSSEQTARYKAAICQRLLDKSSDSKFLDLTGGFGVDFAFMSPLFDDATYVERDPQLYAIATANFRTLGLNVSTHNADASAFPPPHPLTLIYLDPARRDTHGVRTYAIADCSPNILSLKDTLLQSAEYVLLKLSPMLDWRKAIADLGEQNVHEVHIVAVNNECKELLILLSSSPTPPAITLHCVNDGDDFTLTLTQEQQHPSLHPLPLLLEDSGGAFLYEPNAAVMKAGCFDVLAERYAVAPLAPNSHLFVSPTLIPDFPGRRFLITAISSLNKRDIKLHLGSLRQANITTRNFPLSVAELRRRLKLADGGNTYIFATTLADGFHTLILCTPQNSAEKFGGLQKCSYLCARNDVDEE